ncbi:hypothetical protein ACFWOG_31770 [Kitasatospora sp. NPDC058406]
MSDQHRQAAKAHTNDAREKSDNGKAAGKSITHANNANTTAARLGRKGR